jgi:hypothetical protein
LRAVCESAEVRRRHKTRREQPDGQSHAIRWRGQHTRASVVGSHPHARRYATGCTHRITKVERRCGNAAQAIIRLHGLLALALAVNGTRRGARRCGRRAMSVIVKLRKASLSRGHPNAAEGLLEEYSAQASAEEQSCRSVTRVNGSGKATRLWLRRRRNAAERVCNALSNWPREEGGPACATNHCAF